ncbi:hypothetical protein [Streptomyces sp. S.PB5]|nr:hypothetical protein [Streptomyces sp. S.PB5]MDN3027110.1 hypothetical protein [Streptomyces sp. S.PB5]
MGRVPPLAVAAAAAALALPPALALVPAAALTGTAHCAVACRN